jgi:glycosyltransferase involved in cell wall biosynthesis
MDDDLQHHPKYLPSLLAKIEKAEADVVYADYHTKHQKIWKNIGSRIHGKIAEWVIYKPKEVYLSPYKVIRKDVADLICGYSGPNPHIDGLLFQFTSRICQIPVDHYPRYGGRSTYSFWRSAAVSARLAFSFSVRPLRFISLIGFMLAALAMLFVLVIVFYRLYFPEEFTPYAVGWASLMTTFLLVSGIQLVFFGVLGEYAGRTYLNINNQPQSSIREVLNAGKQISPPASQENVRYRQASTGYKSGLESIL